MLLEVYYTAKENNKMELQQEGIMGCIMECIRCSKLDVFSGVYEGLLETMVQAILKL